METPTLYALAGIALFALGLHALIARAHLVAKILGLNVMSTGVFMFLIAIARRHDPPDPVPHAMVLTGIVVAVSATALALVLALRVRAATGKAELPEKDPQDA